jgi:Amt family ammonium transporter
LTGTLLAGVFAVNAIGGTAGLIEGNAQQVLIQLYGIRHAGVVRRHHLRTS